MSTTVYCFHYVQIHHYNNCNLSVNWYAFKTLTVKLFTGKISILHQHLYRSYCWQLSSVNNRCTKSVHLSLLCSALIFWPHADSVIRGLFSQTRSVNLSTFRSLTSTVFMLHQAGLVNFGNVSIISIVNLRLEYYIVTDILFDFYCHYWVIKDRGVVINI